MKQKPGILSDLEVNRQGNLTPAQEKRLRDDFSQRSIMVWGIVLGGAALLFFTSSPQAYGALVLLVIAAIIGAGSYSQRLSRSLQVDVIKGSVRSLTGKISLDIQEGSRGSISYFVRIGRSSWKVSKVQFLSFSNGELYRIYFAPRTGTLLSYERVSDSYDVPEKSKTDADSVFMGTVEGSQGVYLSLANDGELIKVDKDKKNKHSDAAGKHATTRDL